MPTPARRLRQTSSHRGEDAMRYPTGESLRPWVEYMKRLPLEDQAVLTHDLLVVYGLEIPRR